MKKVYVVIQVDGSSIELYANAFDTVEDANNFREACSHDGGYATTPPVEVPEAMAEYVSEIGEIIQSLRSLEVVEDPDGK